MERRDGERVGCDALLDVQYMNLKSSHLARALNCGAGGLAFETGHKLQVGAIIFIKKKVCPEPERVHPECPRLPTSSFGTVQWVDENRYEGRLTYSVGVKNFSYGSYY